MGFGKCYAAARKVISSSLDIGFIHGDTHGRSCKKDIFPITITTALLINI